MDPISVIKQVIVAKGLKKQAVANAMGLSPQQFSDLLAGRRLLRQSDIIKICDILNITPNILYGFNDKSTIEGG